MNSNNTGLKEQADFLEIKNSMSWLSANELHIPEETMNKKKGKPEELTSDSTQQVQAGGHWLSSKGTA